LLLDGPRALKEPFPTGSLQKGAPAGKSTNPAGASERLETLAPVVRTSLQRAYPARAKEPPPAPNSNSIKRFREKRGVGHTTTNFPDRHRRCWILLRRLRRRDRLAGFPRRKHMSPTFGGRGRAVAPTQSAKNIMRPFPEIEPVRNIASGGDSAQKRTRTAEIDILAHPFLRPTRAAFEPHVDPAQFGRPFQRRDK
jgi:hypothetical protein